MKRLFLAGHRGMVGSALLRQLQASGAVEILTASRAELDLLNQQAVNASGQGPRGRHLGQRHAQARVPACR